MIGGFIIYGAFQLIGQVLLFYYAAGIIVGVNIAHGISHPLGALIVPIAQVRWHVAHLAGGYIGLGLRDGRDDRGRFWRGGQVDGGLRERDSRFWHANELSGLGRRHGHLERGRIGHCLLYTSDAADE